MKKKDLRDLIKEEVKRYFSQKEVIAENLVKELKAKHDELVLKEIKLLLEGAMMEEDVTEENKEEETSRNKEHKKE